MERLNQIIAENLKEIRKGKGLSLEQASALTSISKSMLSQLERGEVNPTISTVYKLSLGIFRDVPGRISGRRGSHHLGDHLHSPGCKGFEAGWCGNSVSWWYARATNNLLAILR